MISEQATAPVAQSGWSGPLRRWADRLEAGIESSPGSVLVGLLVLYFLQALGRSPKKLFWFDEYLLYWIAQLPNAQAVWESVRDAPLAVDPPFYHLLANLLFHLHLPYELAIRLPSIVGYGVMLACVFLFVRRRMSTSAALFAGAFAIASPLAIYSVEARPYGWVVGCAACTLLCYQRATERTGQRAPWLVGLCLSLAAALASHYFATLLLIPFVLAELVRYRQMRRWDWPLWISLALPCVVILLYLPLLPAARTYRAQNEGAPGMKELLWAYTTAASPLLLPALGLAAAWAARRKQPVPADEPSPLPAHELAAVGALFLLPVAGLVLGRVATGHFEGRYTLSFEVGLVILLALGLYRVGRVLTGLPAVLAIAFLLFGVKTGLLDLLRPDPAARSFQKLTSSALSQHANLPILVGGAELCFGAHIYHPSFEPRVTCVADGEGIRQHTRRSYESLGVLYLLTWKQRGWIDWPLEDFATYGPGLERYLVWSEGWLPERLLRQGASVQLLDQLGPAPIYLVTRQPGSAPLLRAF